jgi:peptidyl-prolyl cis-trans isomerase D
LAFVCVFQIGAIFFVRHVRDAMFDFIRTHQRWMQGILLILIVPSFLFVGVQGYSSFMSEAPKIATVNGQAITQQDYDRARREQLDQYRQIMGAQFELALFDTPVMRQRVLEQLINQHLLAAAMTDYRFSVSDEKLRSTIAANAALQDDGRFSPERYRRLLAARGITPVIFEANLRRALAIDTVLTPIGQSVQFPETVLASVEKILTETRHISLRRYVAVNYHHQVQVSEADIQKWYDTNKQQYQVPDQVQADYLMLDQAAATTHITVRDADIAQYYAQNKSSFAQPERRRASHIMVKIPGQATEAQRTMARTMAEGLARQAAAEPTKFAELAKKCSQDAGSAVKGGDLGWLVSGMLTAHQQKAIDALAPGQVSPVIESPYGFHVFQLTDLQPAHLKPLAAVRDQILDTLRKQGAARRFAEMATQLSTQIYDQPDGLGRIADTLGLKVRRAAGITQTHLLPADEVGPDAAAASPDASWLNHPRVRQALFSRDVLHDKQNSGVIELAADRLIVVRVAGKTPSHILALKQVKEKIREQLVGEHAAVMAAKAGEQALLGLRNTAKKLAAANPSAPPSVMPPATQPLLTEGFSPAIDVSRQNPQTLSAAVLEAVMRLPAAQLPAYVATPDGDDYVIARVEKTKQGDSHPDATTHANLKQQLASAWGQAEEEAVLKLLRTQYKVQIEPQAEAVIPPQ